MGEQTAFERKDNEAPIFQRLRCIRKYLFAAGVISARCLAQHVIFAKITVTFPSVALAKKSLFLQMLCQRIMGGGWNSYPPLIFLINLTEGERMFLKCFGCHFKSRGSIKAKHLWSKRCAKLKNVCMLEVT